MADGRTEGRRRDVAELLFLDRGHAAVRGVITLIVLVACGVAGALSLAVQAHFAAQPGGGRIASFLAHGSSAATAWIGWAAAAFFTVALVRLRRADPEPPAGRAAVETLTAAQLRAGLVREYTAVRAGFVALCVVSLADVARALRYWVAAVAGDQLARTSLAATLVEAAGLVVAAGVLLLWGIAFRDQLVRIGALPR